MLHGSKNQLNLVCGGILKALEHRVKLTNSAMAPDNNNIKPVYFIFLLSIAKPIAKKTIETPNKTKPNINKSIANPIIKL